MAWRPFAAMILTGLSIPLAYWTRTAVPELAVESSGQSAGTGATTAIASPRVGCVNANSRACRAILPASIRGNDPGLRPILRVAHDRKPRDANWALS